jgi:hypothetical protein
MAMKQPRAARLEERIDELRAEIDSIIDERVETIAYQSPGVPSGVIRNLLTARAPTCRCAQYLELCSERSKKSD